MAYLVRRVGAALLVLASSVLPSASAQSNSRAQPRVLSESPAEFTRVLQAAELGTDLVVIIDSRERSASIINLREGSLRAFAPSGAGPREIGFPWRLVPLARDSAAIMDAQHARAIIVRADGTPGAFVRVPGGPASHSLGERVASARVLPSGDLVFERRDGDTLSLVRMGVAGQSRPISRLRRPADAGRWPTTASGVPQVERKADTSSGNMNPFPYPNEVWEVAPDGWVAIVSRAPYRVAWVTPAGERREGPSYSIESRPISAATRDSVATEHVRDVPGLGMPRPGRYRWPASLPAFAIGRAPTLLIDPRGRVWVRRLHVAEAPAQFDVFDRTGRRVRQVSLEANERLVGFGQTSLLVAVRNEDDLEAIRRVRFEF